MEYIDRTYRKHFRQDRWSYFTIAYKETDLCIGVDRGSWQPEIPVCAERFVRELRTDMDRWIGSHPDYAQALTPFQASGDAPGIFKEMSRVTQTSGIGPMSAVAGAVALKGKPEKTIRYKRSDRRKRRGYLCRPLSGYGYFGICRFFPLV